MVQIIVFPLLAISFNTATTFFIERKEKKVGRIGYNSDKAFDNLLTF
jgi:hypothetical protein